MRLIIFCCLCCSSALTYAQVKHAANWCFGKGAGIAFTDTGSVQFPCVTDNFESNATFSDREGQLLLYTSFSNEGELNEIKNASNIVIEDGDSIRFINTITNGAVFLPVQEADSLTYLLQIALNYDRSIVSPVFSLFFTKIVKSNSRYKVEGKNIALYIGDIMEKLAVVKHADGKSWWIYVHGNTNNGCNQQYIRYKLSEHGDFEGPYIQNIGSSLCSGEGIYGEMAVSPDGSYLATTLKYSGKVELFEIDRCNGLLSFIRSVFHPDSDATYGVAFSQNSKNLYIASNWGGTIADTSAIYQYGLDSTGGSGGLSTLYKANYPQQEFAQLELGLNGKIYVAHRGGNMFSPDTFYTKCLSVINKPDLTGMACNFQPFSYCFTDTVKTYGGLPHLPNFNLTPHPVFTATAGPDTLQCDNGHGVNLGVPPVANVVYQWNPATGLSNATAAQPLASPEVDTWYYLTATDTTATSCAVHVDSVLVQVTRCTGIEEQTIGNALKLYPNPAKDMLYISAHQQELIQCTLFALDGRQVLKQQVRSGRPIDVSPLYTGLYIYLLEANGQTARGKVMIK